jgi:hypothetical protein
LGETAYLFGDDVFEEFVSIAQEHLKTKPKNKLSRNEEMLKAIYEFVSQKKPSFIFTNKLCEFLNAMDGPWKDYRKGQGITGHSIWPLLKPYEIEADTEAAGDLRGCQIKPFLDPWQRVLQLELPGYLAGIGIVPDNLTI